MGELFDFVAFFKSRDRVSVSQPEGVVVPFTGVRYSRMGTSDAEHLSPQGAVASGGKRRKGKSR